MESTNGLVVTKIFSVNFHNLGTKLNRLNVENVTNGITQSV